MKPSFKARRKVEREGEPKARCQLATKLAAVRDCNENKEDGGCKGAATARERAAGAGGTDKCHEPASAALRPVRKGKVEVGVSKKEKGARQVGEYSVPMRANEGGDAEERVGQV
jgi:hypothetical protein